MCSADETCSSWSEENSQIGCILTKYCGLLGYYEDVMVKFKCPGPDELVFADGTPALTAEEQDARDEERANKEIEEEMNAEKQALEDALNGQDDADEFEALPGEKESRFNVAIKNWDDEVVEDNGWFKQELFSIGDDVSVTPENISYTTVIIIVVVASCCCYCSWRNRNKIEAEVRRASTFVRRQSTAIRRSVKIKLGLPVEDEIPQVDQKQVVSQFRGNRNQKAFLRDFMNDQNADEAQEQYNSKNGSVQLEGTGNKRPRINPNMRSATIKVSSNKQYLDINQHSNRSLGDDDYDSFDPRHGNRYKRAQTIVKKKHSNQADDLENADYDDRRESQATGQGGEQNVGLPRLDDSDEEEDPGKVLVLGQLKSDDLGFGAGDEVYDQKLQHTLSAEQYANNKKLAEDDQKHRQRSGTMAADKGAKTVKWQSQNDTESIKQSEQDDYKNFMNDFQQFHNDNNQVTLPDITRVRGLSRVQAILAQFEMEDFESVMQSEFAETVDGQSMHGRSRADTKKTMGSVNKAKFMELIDMSKNLLEDLNQHEEMKLEAGKSMGMFYKQSEEEKVQVMSLAPDADEVIMEEEDEGEVISGKRKTPSSSGVKLSELDLMKENDSDFQEFRNRKDTIISNMTSLAHVKFANDPKK